MQKVIEAMKTVYANTELTDAQKAEQIAAIKEQTVRGMESLYNPEYDSYDIGANGASAIRDEAHEGSEKIDKDLAKNFGTELQDGVENKATPNFYGMLGLIYKPIQQLNVAAFANYIGKRSYATKYNSEGEDLSQRLTVNLKVGYTPVDNVEVFFNAHNLLNNKKREFVYCDQIHGLYTVGVNFNF